jgi:IPT/TIG domain/Galactose oxidase, central domain
LGVPCAVPQDWTNLAPSTPPLSPTRSAASMTFDPATNQLILFGGTNNSAYSNRTYNWNGTTWIQLTPATSPAARSYASMNFDATTRQLILFGGFGSGNTFGDTWNWNGTNWIQLTPTNFPSARQSAVMAFSQSTRQLILFGGYNGSFLGDTWSWDGTDWTQLFPTNSPSARFNASMAYDEGTGQLILFGGLSSSVLGDTWSWDGTDWTQLFPINSPSIRSSASMTYNPLIGRLVLFGGADLPNNYYNDTWSWDGTNWTQLVTTNAPSIRESAVISFDDATGQTILFGGVGPFSTVLSDTWNLGFPVPTVTGITLNQGSTLGGNTVTITGTNFYCDVTVAFGSNNATNITIVSPTQITATTPPGTGTVNVLVTAPGGTSAAAAGNQFTYIAPPTVASISPTQGPTAGGTSVSLTGTNLNAATAVSFGGTPATSFIVISSTQITAVSPPEAAGSVNITVTTVGGTSTAAASNLFTYVAPPTVASISPTQGPTAGGTSVSLTGTNLNAATAVSFGGTPATSFIVISSTQITAVSPPEAAGSVNITVTTVGGTSTAAAGNLFTYVAPPTVTSITPMQGPTAGGTSVVLAGTDFTQVTAVSFGSTPATSFVVDSNNQITAVSPAEAAGNVNIIVTAIGGNSTAAAGNLFTYIAPPAVTSIAPDDGAEDGGTLVTLTGTNLINTSAVLFGSTPATSFTVISDTEITAVSPAAPAGTVNITVTTAGGTSIAAPGNLFSYIPLPSVTGVSSAQGPSSGGTTVTLTGINFSTVTSVLFGSIPATSFIVISDTQIIAISPPKTAGNVNITVINIEGTSSTSSNNIFTYIGLPTLTGVSPSQGPISGGTLVTLTGTSLSTTSAVFFGSIPALSFTVISDNEITAVSPAEAQGIVNITVTNVEGTSASSSATSFAYISLPEITSISPNQGLTSGGTPVTILGSNFTSTTAVLFGNTPALSFVVVSDHQINAISPAALAGVYNITVMANFDTSFPVAASQFTYVLPILPPKNAKVHQVSNRFATQTDRINVITWQAPSSGIPPVAYKIFRDSGLTQLVVVVPADRTHLKFSDHNRKKEQTYNYYLVSIDAKNQQSVPIHLKVGKTK